MDYITIHKQEPNSFNVVCRNGSAHVPRTHFKEFVTCELCKDPKKLEAYLEKIWKKYS